MRDLLPHPLHGRPPCMTVELQGSAVCVRACVRACMCVCVCGILRVHPLLFSLPAVAFSGGCDSAALMGVAREIFGKGVTAVTVDHR